jgi:NAD(P)-dependent dehydrogenase (short-subunit alcohol dehydrogenase family)
MGAHVARTLAQAGHTVYAGLRGTSGFDAAQIVMLQAYAAEHDVDLRTVELDVASQASVDAAIEEIVAVNGRLDVVIQDAGYMVFGAAEAFAPNQFARLYDLNILGPQRVTRAALTQLRKQGQGLLVWISGGHGRGGTPPYLAPCFTATAAMDSLAVSYAAKLAGWGIETSIIMPGCFDSGARRGKFSGPLRGAPRAPENRVDPCAELPMLDLGDMPPLEPAATEAAAIADAIVRVVSLPPGKRPFRTNMDSLKQGHDVVGAVAGWVRSLSGRRHG